MRYSFEFRTWDSSKEQAENERNKKHTGPRREIEILTTELVAAEVDDYQVDELQEVCWHRSCVYNSQRFTIGVKTFRQLVVEAAVPKVAGTDIVGFTSSTGVFLVAVYEVRSAYQDLS